MSEDKRQALPLLDDPMVRGMARENHLPTERWTSAGSMDTGGDGILIYLRCQECYQAWPCATQVELRRLADEARAGGVS